MRQHFRSARGVLPFLMAMTTSGAHGAPGALNSEALSPVLIGPEGQPSSYLDYSVSLDNGPTPAVQFINVVGSGGEWLVRNMVVGARPGTEEISMPVDASLFVPGQRYQTMITSAAQSVAPAFADGEARTLGSAETYWGQGRHGLGDGWDRPAPPQPWPPRPEPPPWPPPPLVPNWRDFLPFVPGMGSAVQNGVNTCVPTAVANSITGLNERFSLGITKTTEQIRDELIITMNTSSETGTNYHDMFIGKTLFLSGGPYVSRLFIDEHYIDSLFIALKAGSDVEIGYRGLIDDVQHMVSVFGMLRETDRSATLFVQDPARFMPMELKIYVDTLGSTTTVFIDNIFCTYVEQTITEIPEPCSLLLCLLGFGWCKSRRRCHRTT